MDYSLSRLGAVQIVTLAGPVDRKSAGTLYDVLLKCVGWRGARLAVDLSRVTRLTRAGARGIIVAAKLAEATGGEMRICGAKPMVFVFLRGLGFEPFMKIDRTLAEGLAILGRDDAGVLDAAAPELALPELFRPANDPAPGLRRMSTGTDA